MENLKEPLKALFYFILFFILNFFAIKSRDKTNVRPLELNVDKM